MSRSVIVLVLLVAVALSPAADGTRYKEKISVMDGVASCSVVCRGYVVQRAGGLEAPISTARVTLTDALHGIDELLGSLTVRRR